MNYNLLVRFYSEREANIISELSEHAGLQAREVTDTTYLIHDNEDLGVKRVPFERFVDIMEHFIVEEE